jgi:hypothetical protein
MFGNDPGVVTSREAWRCALYSMSSRTSEANGSRECAPDEKLRDIHHIVANISVARLGDGFRKCSTHPTG